MANENRQCKDWLTSYCEFTSEQESPSMFHLWMGLSVLASTLGRKCYIDRGYYTLFPNLYIVLVGGSARAKKTTAINIGYDIYRDAFPDACLISQKITPEALIGVLTGNTGTSSGGTIVSDELSVFLGNSNKDATLIQLLTKLYDCGSRFDYHTLIRGREVVQNVYMNMVGGTTPDWIKASLPAHAIGGGFTSRVVFIYQFGPEKLVPFPHLTEAQKKLRLLLIEDLREISKIEGMYELSKDAHDWYEEWYCKVLSKTSMDGESALDGYYGRKHDTLLKVGMCVSASHSSNLLMEKEDLKVGLTAMDENEKFLPQIMKSVMETLVGEEKGKVYRIIDRRGSVAYYDLLRQVSYCMDARRVNEVIESLLAEEIIRESVKEGKRWFQTTQKRK